MKSARLFGVISGILFTLALAFLYTQRSYLYFLTPVFAAVNDVKIAGSYATYSGTIRATQFLDNANTTYLLDPNATGTSLNLAGSAVAVGFMRGNNLVIGGNNGAANCNDYADGICGTNNLWLMTPGHIYLNPNTSGTGSGNNGAVSVGTSVGADKGFFQIDGNYGGNAAFTVKAANSANDVLAASSSGGLSYLVVKSTGNVGIGTRTPAQMVDISSTAPSFQMTDTTASAKSLRLVTDGNFASFYEAAGAAGDILSLDLANKRVGIGTNAPVTSLEVSGATTQASYLTVSGDNSAARSNSLVFNFSDGVGARIFANRAISGANTDVDLLFRSGGDITKATLDASGNITFGQGTTTGTTTLDIAGTTTTNGLCHSSLTGVDAQGIRDCSGAPADIAEFYPGTADQEPGDLVTLTADPIYGNRVVKSLHTYNQNVIGVVSTIPTGPNGGAMGEDIYPNSTYPQAIGLLGRVAVKVNLENGPIQVNDWLTSSSTPGVAMKATKASRVIGRAIEPYDGSVQVSSGTREQEKGRKKVDIHVNKDPVDPPTGTGKILVFTNPTYYDPDLAFLNTDGIVIQGQNSAYQLKNKTNNTAIDRIGAFGQLIAAHIQAGMIQTKQLIINGMDVAAKLSELSNKIDKQNETIRQLQMEVQKLQTNP